MERKEKERDRQIKVPPHIHKLVKIQAVKEGKEMREWTTEAIEFYMEHRDKIK